MSWAYMKIKQSIPRPSAMSCWSEFMTVISRLGVWNLSQNATELSVSILFVRKNNHESQTWQGIHELSPGCDLSKWLLVILLQCWQLTYYSFLPILYSNIVLSEFCWGWVSQNKILQLNKYGLIERFFYIAAPNLCRFPLIKPIN